MIFVSIKKAQSIYGIFLCKKRPRMSDFDYNQIEVKTGLICLTIWQLNIAYDWLTKEYSLGLRNRFIR